MAKGRTLGRAVHSKVTPPAGMRWAPPANAHARCVGGELRGKKGGGRAGVAERFTSASKACKGKK